MVGVRTRYTWTMLTDRRRWGEDAKATLSAVNSWSADRVTGGGRESITGRRWSITDRRARRAADRRGEGSEGSMTRQASTCLFSAESGGQYSSASASEAIDSISR